MKDREFADELSFLDLLNVSQIKLPTVDDSHWQSNVCLSSTACPFKILHTDFKGNLLQYKRNKVVCCYSGTLNSDYNCPIMGQVIPLQDQLDRLELAFKQMTKIVNS